MSKTILGLILGGVLGIFTCRHSCRMSRPQIVEIVLGSTSRAQSGFIGFFAAR
jgi:hypothetical protein